MNGEKGWLSNLWQGTKSGAQATKDTADLSASVVAAGVSWLPLLVAGGLTGAAYKLYKNSGWNKQKQLDISN